jgi:hypothetical protein
LLDGAGQPVRADKLIFFRFILEFLSVSYPAFAHISLGAYSFFMLVMLPWSERYGDCERHDSKYLLRHRSQWNTGPCDVND